MRMLRTAMAGWLGVYAVVYVGFLYLPVLLLPIFSVNDSAVPVFPLKGLTTKWYDSLAGNDVMLSAAWNSLVVGCASAVLATVLGICAARAITRYRFTGQRPMSALIMAPLVLPEIIIAVSLLLVMLQLGLGLSLVTVVLGHVLICLPYAMTVLISGFEGFDNAYEEASLDLGETAFGTLRRVTLPMMAPAIISSLLVSFTISLDEFMVAFFLSGSDPTLPIYIWGQLRFASRLPAILALGTLMLAASLVLLTVAEILRRRAARRTDADGGLIA
ncbi:ABC transporter permease [Pararhizobium mangrovi]|uniref:ABC transporter permease n=1 Tax=Pararhizobium mangrovi TaxID=2590452 RepID=A0A506U2E5_9HYPH|nr:ABC transporter permease [Pararhizobium mangrovi]TPW27441.1 ABC transporter permease [Pararhizobium mangrovi]